MLICVVTTPSKCWNSYISQYRTKNISYFEQAYLEIRSNYRSTTKCNVCCTNGLFSWMCYFICCWNQKFISTCQICMHSAICKHVMSCKAYYVVTVGWIAIPLILCLHFTCRQGFFLWTMFPKLASAYPSFVSFWLLSFYGWSSKWKSQSIIWMAYKALHAAISELTVHRMIL